MVLEKKRRKNIILDSWKQWIWHCLSLGLSIYLPIRAIPQIRLLLFFKKIQHIIKKSQKCFTFSVHEMVYLYSYIFGILLEIFMFAIFMISIFIFTITKVTFSKMSFSLWQKTFIPLLSIYIINYYLNK